MRPGLIKICGLSTPGTMDVALDHGADMVGLVFFAKSPRHVTLEQAAQLAERARGRAEIVALVVDADDASLDALAEQVKPDWFQCHGKESPARVAAIRQGYGCRVMKALGIGEAADLAVLPDYLAVCDRLLLDAKPPTNPQALPGGNGLTFDWTLIANLDRGAPFMLSGGLTQENVAAAITMTGVRAVDVSSGVEQMPGVKDPARIAAFIAAAREAFGRS